MMSCALEHDFYSREHGRLWRAAWRALGAQLHARTPVRKLAIAGSVLLVAATWFWAAMLVAPPVTAAEELHGDVFQINRDAPADLPELVADTM